MPYKKVINHNRNFHPFICARTTISMSSTVVLSIHIPESSSALILHTPAVPLDPKKIEECSLNIERHGLHARHGAPPSHPQPLMSTCCNSSPASMATTSASTERRPLLPSSSPHPIHPWVGVGLGFHPHPSIGRAKPPWPTSSRLKSK